MCPGRESTTGVGRVGSGRGKGGCKFPVKESPGRGVTDRSRKKWLGKKGVDKKKWLGESRGMGTGR